MGQEDSLNGTFVLPYADFPASCLIVLRIKDVSSLTGNIYLNTLSIFISDVRQDSLATPYLDKDAWLAMMSMVHSPFLYIISSSL